MSRRKNSLHLDSRIDELVERLEQYGRKSFLTPQELAALIGVSLKFLEAQRRALDGPRFSRVLPIGVVYRSRDVIKWLQGRAALRQTENA